MVSLLLSLFVFAVLGKVDVEVDEGVYVLTDANYDSFTAEHNMFLVEVYAPWCGHCKRLAPEYSKAAGLLESAGVSAKLAKVDGTVERKLAASFQVQGYPTLKFYRDGHLLEYSGERTADAIVAFVTKKSDNPSTTLKSAAEISSVVAEKSGIRVIGYLPAKKTQKFNIGLGLDDLFTDVNFYVVTDSALFSGKKPGTLELYFEDKPVKTLDGPFGEKKAHSWLALNAFPLVSTEEQARARSKIHPKLDLLVVYVQEDLQGTQTRQFLTEIAEENLDKMIVGISSDASAPEKQGASGRVFPTATFGHGKKTFIWNEDTEEEMTKEALNSFIASSRSGSYVSYIKSEPVPDNEGKGVTVLVGKTIEEVAFHKEKDVLLEFYAPWCGHCKALEPVYEELGQAFINDPNVVIAKMDATANKVPSKFQVQGFPTIVFVPADKGGKPSKPIVFSKHERTLETLTAFIEENRVSTPVKAEL